MAQAGAAEFNTVQRSVGRLGGAIEVQALDQGGECSSAAYKVQLLGGKGGGWLNPGSMYRAVLHQEAHHLNKCNPIECSVQELVLCNCKIQCSAITGGRDGGVCLIPTWRDSDHNRMARLPRPPPKTSMTMTKCRQFSHFRALYLNLNTSQLY